MDIDTSKIFTLVRERLDKLKTKYVKYNYEFNYDMRKTTVYGAFFTLGKSVQISDYPAFHVVIDDESIYYSALRNYLENCSNGNNKFESAAMAVKNTVYSFVGGTNRNDDSERLYLYRTSSEGYCHISNFYNKDCSECSERAILAHNLFRFLGVESYLLQGPITINGQRNYHNYNIIVDNENAYIYDLACTPVVLDEFGNKVKRPFIKQLDNNEISVLNSVRGDEQHSIDLQNVFSDVSFVMPSSNKYVVTYGKDISFENEATL